MKTSGKSKRLCPTMLLREVLDVYRPDTTAPYNFRPSIWSNGTFQPLRPANTKNDFPAE